ncbi:hypothetical protein CEXT_486781 [Caerostris extrusa]|uniref:Uncharacterized protein n=1 Tax=Caerostris extrusa TaxID=172846 RepID=A0AAV4PGU1_CAEEX|nr:hypothetical protein CEXT_486781 [Caerostris extrusa]
MLFGKILDAKLKCSFRIPKQAYIETCQTSHSPSSISQNVLLLKIAFPCLSERLRQLFRLNRLFGKIVACTLAMGGIIRQEATRRH